MERIGAADWFAVHTLPDGVTAIGEPHVREFYRCNIWHVRGRDRDMLVDSGMGVVSLRAQLPLLTGRPLTAVASHTHFDHIGGHHEFEDRAVHAAEAAILADPTPVNTYADRYVSDDIFTALPPVPYRSATYALRGAPATRMLADGDVIDLGDRQFDVIHTPGHSPGGIALWEAATGLLFAGDIVYDGPLIEGESAEEQVQYEHSMRRLLALPVRVVHAGHFPSYDGVRHRAIIAGWLAGRGD